MTTQPQTHSPSRHQRSQWTRRSLLALLALVVGAVVWDMVRAVTQPRSQVNFTATTLQGKDWSLDTYRGKKPVMLSFFGTWCQPCKIELPHLIALKEKYRERGVELVIITRETAEEVRKAPEFLTMPVTLITDGSPIFEKYKIEGVPHTYLFDQSGKLAFEAEGYTEGSLVDLEKKLATP